MHEEDFQIAIIEHHNTDEYSTSESQARTGIIGITAFPTLIPDGLPEPTWPYTHAILEAKINERMAAVAPCTLELTGSIDGNNLTLDLSILKDAGADMPNPRVQLTITETEIPYTGANYETMNFVNRDMVPDQNGTDITIDGDSHNMTFDVVLDESWDQDHISIVAWVEDGSNHHVMQTIIVDLQDLSAPLAAPANLVAESLDTNNIVLTWDALATAPDYYKIYKNNEHLEDVPATTTTFTDVLEEEGEYQYYVTAMVGEDESPASNVVTITFVDNDEVVSLKTKISNYPNPFSISGNSRANYTTISYSIEDEGHTEISIYDIKGRRVSTLMNSYKEAGDYKTTWSGTNDNNNQVASGVYFMVLKTERGTTSKKLLILK